MLGGRYELVNPLGSGGMAVVWRARDSVLGRHVAVKLLAGRHAESPDARRRIRDEARAAALLSHPNIAQVYDYGEWADGGAQLPYVVMELVRGVTLQQRQDAGPLSARFAMRVSAEVAAALAAAHAEGLVHRDIKPANVMVTPEGAKVVDFGIAAAISPAGAADPDEEVLGTPAYLAPERLTDDAVEPASDVYALGVLLYRLLSGESPWSADTTTQMLTAHVYIDPAPLAPMPGVPDYVIDLCNRCLSKDPTLRPSAREVAALLARGAGLRVVEDEAAAASTTTMWAIDREPSVLIRSARGAGPAAAAARADAVAGMFGWLPGAESADSDAAAGSVGADAGGRATGTEPDPQADSLLRAPTGLRVAGWVLDGDARRRAGIGAAGETGAAGEGVAAGAAGSLPADAGAADAGAADAGAADAGAAGGSHDALLWGLVGADKIDRDALPAYMVEVTGNAAAAGWARGGRDADRARTGPAGSAAADAAPSEAAPSRDAAVGAGASAAAAGASGSGAAGAAAPAQADAAHDGPLRHATPSAPGSDTATPAGAGPRPEAAREAAVRETDAPGGPAGHIRSVSPGNTGGASRSAPAPGRRSDSRRRRAADRPRRGPLWTVAAAVVLVAVAALVWLLVPNGSSGREPGAARAQGNAPSPAGTSAGAPAPGPTSTSGAPLPGDAPAPADAVDQQQPAGPTTGRTAVVDGGGPVVTPDATEPAGGGAPPTTTPNQTEPTTQAPELQERTFTSTGGTVRATCTSPGTAKLLSWSATKPYKVQDVEAGPASSVVVVYKHGNRTDLMTVTCSGGVPSKN